MYKTNLYRITYPNGYTQNIHCLDNFDIRKLLALPDSCQTQIIDKKLWSWSDWTYRR